MKRSEINIRDPFVLVHEGRYYLYGTRSESCWGEMDGFDCYVSPDLVNYEGPYEVFHRPEGYFADRCYWAPECYFYKGAFFLVTTLASAERKKGIYVLKSDSPTGPFLPFGERLTPEDWTGIDGTLYFEDGTPWLVFSHSFEDGGRAANGEFCLVRLKEDLSGPAAGPELLFTAKDTAWAKPFPYAKAEFGIDGDCFFSDGPGLLRLEDGKLYMILSSWSVNGYGVGVAVSDSGKIAGPWRQQEIPLYAENGGHGMFFRDLEGNIIFALHSPNDKFLERPVFWKVKNENGVLSLDGAIMTEREKLHAGLEYCLDDAELAEEKLRAVELCRKLDALGPREKAAREAVVRELFGAAGEHPQVLDNFREKTWSIINLSEALKVVCFWIIRDNCLHSRSKGQRFCPRISFQLLRGGTFILLIYIITVGQNDLRVAVYADYGNVPIVNYGIVSCILDKRAVEIKSHTVCCIGNHITNRNFIICRQVCYVTCFATGGHCQHD